MRGLARAMAWCCGWSTAEQIAARRSKVGRSRSWLGVAVVGRRGRRRCSGRLKRAGRDLGYVCIRKGIAGDHTGELGRGEERKEGDGLTGQAGLSVTERGKEGAERACAERVAGEWARVKKRECGRRLLVDLRRQVGPKGVGGPS